MTAHIKWSSTARLANIVKSMQACGVSSMEYRPKIKLHGANVAFGFENGKFHVQNRTEILNESHDFMEVYKFLSQVGFVDPGYAEKVMVYGEWAGPGCAKNPDVVSSIPEKTLFVFAVLFGESLEKGSLLVEPGVITDIIRDMLPFRGELPARIVVLPWFDEPIRLTAYDDDQNRKVFENINNVVAGIGECDPFIKQRYGIEGQGEGLVYFQYNSTPPENVAPWRFKVKCERHDVIKRSHALASTIIVSPDVISFVDSFVTENRIRQMADENTNGVIAMSQLGKLIPAVMRDVLKEGADEMEASNITAKDLGKYAPQVIRKIVCRIENQI